MRRMRKALPAQSCCCHAHLVAFASFDMRAVLGYRFGIVRIRTNRHKEAKKSAPVAAATVSDERTPRSRAVCILPATERTVRLSWRQQVNLGLERQHRYCPTTTATITVMATTTTTCAQTATATASCCRCLCDRKAASRQARCLRGRCQ